MKAPLTATVMLLAAAAAATTGIHAQHTVRRAIDGRPDAMIDLRTREGPRSCAGSGVTATPRSPARVTSSRGRISSRADGR